MTRDRQTDRQTDGRTDRHPHRFMIWPHIVGHIINQCKYGTMLESYHNKINTAQQEHCHYNTSLNSESNVCAKNYKYRTIVAHGRPTTKNVGHLFRGTIRRPVWRLVCCRLKSIVLYNSAKPQPIQFQAKFGTHAQINGRQSSENFERGRCGQYWGFERLRRNVFLSYRPNTTLSTFQQPIHSTLTTACESMSSERFGYNATII